MHAKSPYWDDPLLLDARLSDEKRMVKDAARRYCEDKLAPRVVEVLRNGTTDPSIFREMGELGLLGPTIPEEYGGSGLNYVAYGIRGLKGPFTCLNSARYGKRSTSACRWAPRTSSPRT